MRAEGVDTSCVTRDTGAPTGLILFEPRLPEVTRVQYYPAGSRLDAARVERAFTAGPPRVLHLTGITPAREACQRTLRLAREHGVPVTLDANYRSRLWSSQEAAAELRDWVPYVDVLIASDDELPLCAPPGPDAVKALLDLGVREVVVKLGADGAVAHSADGELRVPARPVSAVDAVGAGDAFVAGHLSALLDGEDIAARLDRAVTTGAFAVAQPGDWEGAPTRAELGLLGAGQGTVVR
ncbi:sugar kinase [Streptomyces sp. NPDC055955]|uniref:sugar kinase n=1 Tax=Streptomyces sp. NPDC055955 TaxID=3345665 RepID=UPI0035D81FEE